MIEGQTNVRSSRFGAAAIDGIGQELGRFIVTTMDVPWRLAHPRLDAQPTAVIFVEIMELETLDGQVSLAFMGSRAPGWRWPGRSACLKRCAAGVSRGPAA